MAIPVDSVSQDGLRAGARLPGLAILLLAAFGLAGCGGSDPSSAVVVPEAVPGPGVLPDAVSTISGSLSEGFVATCESVDTNEHAASSGAFEVRSFLNYVETWPEAGKLSWTTTEELVVAADSLIVEAYRVDDRANEIGDYRAVRYLYEGENGGVDSVSTVPAIVTSMILPSPGEWLIVPELADERACFRFHLSVET